MPFPSSPGASSQCLADLQNALYQEDWSWQGRCAGCEQHYGDGLPDGRCDRSRPKSVGNVEIWKDTELVEMLGDLGAVGMLTYLGEIDWFGDPTSSQLAQHRRTKILCPRCRAFDAWWYPRCDDFAKRAKVIAKHVS